VNVDVFYLREGGASPLVHVGLDQVFDLYGALAPG
jgi:hypothetical protein